MALAALGRPMITVTHTGGNLNHRFTQMEASNVSEERFYSRMDDAQAKKGMDYFSVDVYDRLLNHMLSHGKFRDAMFLVCMSNWGMRFSDTCRVRYGHIFDKDGYLKKLFSLPDGEQKTGKINVYYNNEAVATAILLYMNNTKRKITPYDYMFVSENSPNKPKQTLTQVEADEMYGHRMKLAEKHMNAVKKQQSDLLKLYSKGTITEEEFAELNGDLREKRKEAEMELSQLQEKYNNYVSQTENADEIFIQKPMSHTAGEDIVKDNLAELGIFTRNRKNKSEEMTLDKKLNTHSLRKTFSENFVNTGTQMNRDGELDVDPTVISLLQNKLMHTNRSTTNRYNQTEEKAFSAICTGMNIGLSILRKYM